MADLRTAVPGLDPTTVAKSDEYLPRDFRDETCLCPVDVDLLANHLGLRAKQDSRDCMEYHLQ